MGNDKIRVTVWGENVHEQRDERVRRIYPQGMHRCIADGLMEMESSGFDARCATLQEPEHGLTADLLENTDVLTWWGHTAHAEVHDETVERVQRRVWEGMGLIVLHSGHYSKLFKRLMGTSCSLTHRESGERERVWVCNPGHPIAQGIDRYFEVPHSEMYGEPFGIPAPDEQVFISWFKGGEVFRSGCTWKRGNGKIFYLGPGHETYPIYHQPEMKRVIKNAVRWACAEGGRWVDSCPKIGPELTPEPLG